MTNKEKEIYITLKGWSKHTKLEGQYTYLYSAPMSGFINATLQNAYNLSITNLE